MRKKPSAEGGEPPAPSGAEDFVRHEGLVLPRRRSNHGLDDDAGYLASAAEQIRPLATRLGPDARILDFGCGQGRLLNGLLYSKTPFGAYLGVDIDAKSVAWCIRHLSAIERDLSFTWYNGNNARYNAGGVEVSDIPVADSSADLIFANSVFSHLEPHDVEGFARILMRKLAPQGIFYLTAFVEEGVEDVGYDPPGYFEPSKSPSRLPLRIVRYEKEFFLEKFTRAGLVLEELRQNGIARTGQSELIFRPADR